MIEARIEGMPERGVTEKVIDSLHSRDGLYCVDLVRTSHGFTLQACRRDEGRWQVISRPSEHADQEDAVTHARALLATFE